MISAKMVMRSISSSNSRIAWERIVVCNSASSRVIKRIGGGSRGKWVGIACVRYSRAATPADSLNVRLFVILSSRNGRNARPWRDLQHGPPERVGRGLPRAAMRGSAGRMQGPGPWLTPPPRAAQDSAIGKRLRLRREALGLDLAAVSVATRLPRRRVEAIEAGEFAAFRAHVYAAGALRSYARLLGLNEAPLLAALDAEARGLWEVEQAIPAARRARRRGCFWGRRGHISLFG
ncbi:helix-turn-helix domain-containing protein [Sphingomonas sp. KR3-1]|uniref:helix-turn-helix domain-containing protein n=1 Tax=Sphingomonas sp. KR3-1 TaxID=3156611 RepID=UPI0032B43906